ncbi:MAG TPA: hypothetical protein VN904_07335, partial [Chthoniobacterales bacterium]|nr:hypothetical protein [Chthoniobacterales bacterium]
MAVLHRNAPVVVRSPFDAAAASPSNLDAVVVIPESININATNDTVSVYVGYNDRIWRNPFRTKWGHLAGNEKGRCRPVVLRNAD